MVSSSSIYVYAYSQTHTWKGDDKTGVKVATNNSETHDDRLLTASFFPLTMKETEDNYQIGFTCDRKTHQITKIKEIKKLKPSRTQKINDISLQDRDLAELDNETEIIRLSEEAAKLTAIARKKEEERQKILDSTNTIAKQVMPKNPISKMSNRKTSVTEALQEEERVARYLQEERERERNNSFDRLKNYGR